MILNRISLNRNLAKEDPEGKLHLKVPCIKLKNSDFSMPYIGLGTYKADKPQELTNACAVAIECGYRFFDCGYIYDNEEQVGAAILESIGESDGNLKREDFFLSGKIWSTYHSHKKVRECLENSLLKLKTNYLDLLVIHWPMGFKEDAGTNHPLDENGKYIPSDVHFTETYRAMEELVNEGKVKYIGLSNFNKEQVQEILDMAKIRPVCNQIEVNPYLPNNELVKFCQNNDLVVIGYASLGASDRPWAKPDDPVPLKDPKIFELAEKYEKTTAQIILRWLIQRNIVVCPKSIHFERINENIRIFDFEISERDLLVFKELEKKPFRFYKLPEFEQHPLYPFRD